MLKKISSIFDSVDIEKNKGINDNRHTIVIVIINR